MKSYPENIIKVPRFHEDNGFYTTAERSRLMGRIKDRNSSAEKKLRHALWALGLRYRKNIKNLPGKPDIVFRRFKLAIFVDGGFWHGHNWKERKNDFKSNQDYWIPKIERNMQRDAEVNQELAAMGWKVMRFWEHEVQKNFGKCLYAICDYLHQVSIRC